MRQQIVNNWNKLPVAIDLHTVALICGVNEATVRRWCNEGKISGQKIGNKWIFGKEYLRSLIEGEGKEQES